MRRIAFALLLLFAFAIPWEYSLDVGEPLGNIARIAGVLALLAAIPAVFEHKQLRAPGAMQLLVLKDSRNRSQQRQHSGNARNVSQRLAHIKGYSHGIAKAKSSKSAKAMWRMGFHLSTRGTGSPVPSSGLLFWQGLFRLGFASQEQDRKLNENEDSKRFITIDFSEFKCNQRNHRNNNAKRNG